MEENKEITEKILKEVFNRFGMDDFDKTYIDGMKKQINGYVYIKRFGHPYTKNGWIAKHRLVVEMFIGRYLKPEESIHHINGIPWDNRIENLFLFPNHKEHKNFENKVRRFGFTRPIIREINERWRRIIKSEPILLSEIIE